MLDGNEIILENSIISNFENEYKEKFDPKILVFGVGGGGVNALNSMAESDLIDVDNLEFVVANTDYQSLEGSKVKNKILLGKKLTRGIGAGADPEVGRAAAEESLDEIDKYLENIDMIFITAGMGGGTGTGAAPVIAKKARERDILVASIVTTPFDVEGSVRMQMAKGGIEELKKNVDTLIIVPNQNLFRLANKDTRMQDSLQMVDNVLKSGVKSIVDLIKKNGFMNLEFSDIRTVMKKIGKAMMGTGEASGENRAIRAVEEAISNPLLDNISIKGAKGVIVNMTGPTDTTLFEFENAGKRIRDEINNEYAKIIFGNVFDDSLGDTIRVSIFATGIDENEEHFIDQNENKVINNDNSDYCSDISNSSYNKNIYNNIESKIPLDEDEYFLNISDEKEKNNSMEKINIDRIDNLDNTDIICNNKNSNFAKKNIVRNKIGGENYYQEDDDIFDMGKAVKYDEFGKKQGIYPSKVFYKEIENNVEELKQNNHNKMTKKSGFFSNFFSNSKKNSSVNIDNGIDDDDDEDLDINLYKTPSYYRNKNMN